MSHAQLTYFVNAESGFDSSANDGLTPVTAWRSLRYTFAQIGIPSPGSFHTVLVAGRYSNANGSLIVHDDALEGWGMNGALLVPPYIQVLYDAANSDNDPALGGYAPVVFDGTGYGGALFLFNARQNEPCSRFDGTNALVPTPPDTAPWEANYFVARNAAIVFEIRPPAPFGDPAPAVAAIPPGASFQRIRFENDLIALNVLAGGQAFGSGPIAHLFSPVVHQCRFTAGPGTGVGGSRQIQVFSRALLNGENPSVALTVRESRLELGTSSGFVAGDGLWLSAEGQALTVPAGAAGTSGVITALVERTEIDGVADRGVRGIYGQGLGFAGNLNLSVRDSSILDLRDAGITVEKSDEGTASLSVQRSAVLRCGWAARPSPDPRLDSGIVLRGTPRRTGTGYAAPITQLVLNLDTCEIAENRWHGVYYHHPWLGNDLQSPLLFGTNGSIVMRDCTLRQNGFTSSEPARREVSGLLAHLEQGYLVGQGSSFPTVPFSAIVENDVFENALHGIELRGRPDTANTMYNIELRGVVAQNDIDRNGFPTVPGPATPSAELLVVADVSNMDPLVGTGVGTNLFVTQNTFFDDLMAGALVTFVEFPLNDWRVSHQQTQFLGNLGVHEPNNQGATAFAGFGTGSPPGVVQSKFGLFDDSGLQGVNFNAVATDVPNFSTAQVNGHFLDVALRNFAIRTNAAPQGPNLAIDRTLGIPGPGPGTGPQLPGQQTLDKNGLNRSFDNPSIPEVGQNTFSDSGSHENQGG